MVLVSLCNISEKNSCFNRQQDSKTARQQDSKTAKKRVSIVTDRGESVGKTGVRR